jgi:hypothetical protein
MEVTQSFKTLGTANPSAADHIPGDAYAQKNCCVHRLSQKQEIMLQQIKMERLWKDVKKVGKFIFMN